MSESMLLDPSYPDRRKLSKVDSAASKEDIVIFSEEGNHSLGILSIIDFRDQNRSALLHGGRLKLETRLARWPSPIRVTTGDRLLCRLQAADDQVWYLKDVVTVNLFLSDAVFCIPVPTASRLSVKGLCRCLQ